MPLHIDKQTWAQKEKWGNIKSMGFYPSCPSPNVPPPSIISYNLVPTHGRHMYLISLAPRHPALLSLVLFRVLFLSLICLWSVVGFPFCQ
jgi:hypothetical protein